MRDIRTITIDLDDTLWAIYPVIMRAERALYDWLGSNYPRITEMYGLEDMWKMRESIVFEYPGKSHDFTFMRRTVLGRLGVAAGYGDGLVDDAMEVFHDFRNDVEIYPEVRPALGALRERYQLIAVTNGNANLDRIGIGDLFHDVVSAATAGAAKPDREIFDAAVAAGGANAEQTVHVGDHPEFDIEGARNAGLKSVWVNRNDQDWPDHLQEPDGIVTHIGELASLLGMEER